MEHKRHTLLQDFQSLINSTLASDSDLRPHQRPSIVSQLGPVLADLRLSRVMTGFETIRDFEGWGEGKQLDFEVEKCEALCEDSQMLGQRLNLRFSLI